jgi:hypothetical protein
MRVIYVSCCVADKIECTDDLYKPAVAYAVGSALVCDSLEEAQDLCFERAERVKVVTLVTYIHTYSTFTFAFFTYNREMITLFRYTTILSQIQFSIQVFLLTYAMHTYIHTYIHYCSVGILSTNLAL